MNAVTRVPADVRRRELVDAAITVMARDGIAKATTRAIVAEADMPLGFFHYCFSSKEEMLLQVIETLNERNLRAALESVKPHDDVAEMLRVGVRAYWAQVEQHPEHHQMTYELTQYALRTPALAGVARKQYEQYAANARTFLDAVSAATGVEWAVPVDVLARKVSSALDGVTLAWVVDRDTEQTLAVLDLFIDQLAAEARRPVRRTAS